MATKKRLIDANALKKYMCFKCNDEYSDEPCEPSDCVFYNAINYAPTVDAVEVVRCRECKHRGTDNCIFHINGEPADEELLKKVDNDFCSYGERKDNDI